MAALFQVDSVIASPSKVGILRVLSSRRGFRAVGREVARLSGFSVPATHESLKDLHARNILKREIIGKQHIYALNEEDRLVQKVIRPMFEVERGVRDEIRRFIIDAVHRCDIEKAVSAVYLYGSVQQGGAIVGSDVDIAVVVARTADVSRVSDIFISTIAPPFRGHFGAPLDPYVKSAVEFRERLKKNQPPVSTLMKAYAVLYGKEPLEV